MPVYPGRSSFRSDTAVETAVFCQAEGASCHGQRTFGTDCSIQIGAAGTSLALTLPCQADGASVKKAARLLGLRLTVLKEDPSAITLLLSCSSMPTGDFRPACGLLKQVIDSF